MMVLPASRRVLELARGGVDVLHHSQRLLELAHGALELAVEDPAVGDDHDGVEDPAVVRAVQGGELVGQPGDGEALAAARRVLDEIAVSRPGRAGVGDEPAHAVELLVAGEDEEAPAGLAPVLVLLLDLVDELAHQVEHAVARPGLLPEIGGGVAVLRRRHGWIAGAAEAAPVEGQEARLRSGQVGGDVDQLGVDGEVREAPAIGEQGLARVTVGVVLPDRVLDGLAGERVLELGREDGDAIQEQHHVETLLVPGAVLDLAGDREEVGGVQPPRLLVEPACGAEVREPERAPHVLHAAPQDVEGAAALDFGREALQEPRPDLCAVVLREPLPLRGLRRQHEVQDVVREEAERAVVVLGAALVVAAGSHSRVDVRWGLVGDAAPGGCPDVHPDRGAAGPLRWRLRRHARRSAWSQRLGPLAENGDVATVPEQAVALPAGQLLRHS